MHYFGLKVLNILFLSIEKYIQFTIFWGGLALLMKAIVNIKLIAYKIDCLYD